MWWVIKQYSIEKRWGLIWALLAFGMSMLVLALYQISMGTIEYIALLCSAIWGCYLFGDVWMYRQRLLDRKKLFEDAEYNLESIEMTRSVMENEYRRLLLTSYEDRRELEREKDEKYRALKEYIMMWSHQIKTPITAVHLLLQQEEQRANSSMSSIRQEVLEIENYVDMTLQYMRLDSMNADLRIEKVSLHEISKHAVRGFSKSFIAKRLSLQLEVPEDWQIVTDEKWLSFVLKQILSNSLKYTKKGTISIYAEKKDGITALCIKDTGCGIASDDLPRIFEQAFTGFNGHMDQKATGIGLFLSRSIMKKLGHDIQITSELGVGTMVKLLFTV